MVARRWAIIRVVRPCISAWKAICTLAFGGRIQGAGRLVEDEDRRVFQEDAGNRQPLALAAAEIGTAFADECLITLRLLQDEVVGLGLAGGPHHLFIRGIGPADLQVLLDSAEEEQTFLETRRRYWRAANRESPAGCRCRRSAPGPAGDRTAA